MNRTKENLVGCDNRIITARHKIIKAVKALREKGTLPPARSPEEQAIHATALQLKRNVHFKDGASYGLKARNDVPQSTVWPPEGLSSDLTRRSDTVGFLF